METEIKKRYHNNGKIEYEHSYVNDVKHGIQKWYCSNDQLIWEFHMKDNQLYGIRQYWHYDGRRNFVQQCKNDQRHGPIIIFKYES
jgi:antitoxin component YwqK of YwqJK toxin-antitoxin module